MKTSPDDDARCEASGWVAPSDQAKQCRRALHALEDSLRRLSVEIDRRRYVDEHPHILCPKSSGPW